MPQTFVTQLETKLELNDIKDVVMTEIEVDSAGNFVREFRFFGTPNDPTIATPPKSLAVRVLATTREALEVTTPALQI